MKAEKKVRARRQRIPAFGEWNYAYVDGAGDWPVTQYFDSAMHAGGLVMAIPPSPPKPANKVVKWRESGTTTTLELDDEDEKQQRQHVVVGLGLGDHGDHGGAVKTKLGKQQQSPVVLPHAYKACHRVGVVKAMDQDLYHIPPDMLCHEPRKRLTRRSLWMGCLGLNCVA